MDRTVRIRNRHRRAGGFTLLEIMIVLGLLLVLGSVAVMGFMQVKKKADVDATSLLVKNTAESVKLYQSTMNMLPDNDSGLTALIERPADEVLAQKWAGPYLEDRKIPVDPWGSELMYLNMDVEMTGEDDGPPFRVWSIGPDKQDGTDDDIRSWTEDDV